MLRGNAEREGNSCIGCRAASVGQSGQERRQQFAQWTRDGCAVLGAGLDWECELGIWVFCKPFSRSPLPSDLVNEEELMYLAGCIAR